MFAFATYSIKAERPGRSSRAPETGLLANPAIVAVVQYVVTERQGWCHLAIRLVSVGGVRLTASANTIHVGRKTATTEGRVHDPDGRLVAHGTTACIIHR